MPKDTLESESQRSSSALVRVTVHTNEICCPLDAGIRGGTDGVGRHYSSLSLSAL
jgi:hypothetical protein